ncbi:hypothetical protein EYY98_11055 [Obesumbacterium proteus]|nr:hypothetical protein EYY98_11055 [Obesumbacterium proteus]
MTKLTTERLDEIANIKITEFSDGTDTANGAYQSVGSSEIVLMARQLLAYEKAAPVLPKQPEHRATKLDLATIKLWNWDAKITMGETEENCEEWIAARAILSLSDDLLALLAQPVIPEQNKFRFLSQPVDPQISEYEKALQNEPQNIPENIPAQPVSELREIAIALYKPPFKFDCGYIWDAGGQMVADNNLDKDEQILRVRGWGRISYLENAEALQDEVGEVIAIALSDYWNRNIEAAPAQESE